MELRLSLPQRGEKRARESCITGGTVSSGQKEQQMQSPQNWRETQEERGRKGKEVRVVCLQGLVSLGVTQSESDFKSIPPAAILRIDSKGPGQGRESSEGRQDMGSDHAIVTVMVRSS